MKLDKFFYEYLGAFSGQSPPEPIAPETTTPQLPPGESEMEFELRTRTAISFLRGKYDYCR